MYNLPYLTLPPLSTSIYYQNILCFKIGPVVQWLVLIELQVRAQLRKNKNIDSRKSSAGYRKGINRPTAEDYARYNIDSERAAKFQRTMKFEFFQYASYNRKIRVIREIYGDKIANSPGDARREVLRLTTINQIKTQKHQQKKSLKVNTASLPQPCLSFCIFGPVSQLTNRQKYAQQALVDNPALLDVPYKALVKEFRRQYSDDNFRTVWKFIDGFLDVEASYETAGGKYFIKSKFNWATTTPNTPVPVPRGDVNIC